MQLSELILLVLRHSDIAVGDYTRGPIRPAAEQLAFIANKITTELPNIELPPPESFESPAPAEEVPE